MMTLAAAEQGVADKVCTAAAEEYTGAAKIPAAGEEYRRAAGYRPGAYTVVRARRTRVAGYKRAGYRPAVCTPAEHRPGAEASEQSRRLAASRKFRQPGVRKVLRPG
jgi:hypothetical protein